MSDSPQEENKPLLPPKGGEKERIVNSKTNIANKLQNPLQEKPAKLPLALKLIAGLAAIALIAFAGIVGLELLQKSEQQNQEAATAIQESANEPVSILPVEPGGVTILKKQPETDQQTAALPAAPIAQGADLASGFAMDVGAADSYLDLTRKFAELVEINGAENFQRLEPRAVLTETITGLEARLLIGPFETLEQATEACAILILQEGSTCLAEPFQGDLIARE